MKILVGLASFPLLVAPPREEKIVPGNPLPDLEFRTVLGGDGRTKLSDFRGQPVLIVWYSTVFAGIEGARVALDMQEEFAAKFGAKNRVGGLVLFLMEIKNHDASYMRALQMAELPGADCRLLKNQELHVVYDSESGFPPHMVLIGVDGTLLYAGSYQSAGVVKKLLAVEREKLEEGWGTDPLARQARALGWGQGKLGEARQLLDPALVSGASEELTRLGVEIERRVDTLALAVKHHLDQGEIHSAKLASDDLTLAAQGRANWVGRAQGVAASVQAAAAEGELEEKLDALLKPTLKSKPKKGLDGKLRAFAEETAGTKVGARAGRLAEAVAKSLEGL